MPCKDWLSYHEISRHIIALYRPLRQTSVSITKDADVTIESKGDISINDGFKMETGSVVTIKTTGNVIISGGTMESGANLSITAPSISVLKNFSAEKGAMLNLNYE